MKTTPIIQKAKIACLTFAAIGLAAGSAQAQVVIGSWTSSGQSDSWIDNTVNSYNYDPSVNNVANSANFVTGASLGIPGFSSGLELLNQNSTWSGTLGIGLGYAGHLSDFLANTEFQITFSVPAGTQGGTPQVDQLQIFAPGLSGGYVTLAASTLTIGGPAAADGNTVSQNGGKGVGFNEWSGSPARSVTMTWDYSSVLAAIGATPSYVNLQLTTSSSGNSDPLVFNNAELLSPAPEPTTLALAGLGGLASLVALRRKK
jgi:hypothetical protein